MGAWGSVGERVMQQWRLSDEETHSRDRFSTRILRRFSQDELHTVLSLVRSFRGLVVGSCLARCYSLGLVVGSLVVWRWLLRIESLSDSHLDSRRCLFDEVQLHRVDLDWCEPVASRRVD